MYIYFLVASLVFTVSCTKTASKNRSDAPATIEGEVDEFGNMSASIEAANGGIINLSSSSNQSLQDVNLIVPAGSLSIDSLVSVKEATDVVNADTAEALNISSASRAGPSVAVEATNSASINGALILSLPYTPSLGLVEVSYIVIGIYFENGKPKVETFVGSEITIKTKTIEVAIKRFGAYQVAKVSQVVEKITKDSETSYVDKSVANAAGGLVNSVYMITTLTSLPVCGTDRMNHLYFVKNTNTFHVCNGQAWSVVSVKGDKGDTGAKGDTGNSGVLVLGTPLKRLSNNSPFGYLQGLAPNQWVRFTNGFYSPVKPITGNYKVVREPVYFETLDCTTIPYLSLTGPFDIARLSYTGASDNPFTYAETMLMPLLPGSVIDPNQNCYILGMFTEIDDRNGSSNYISGITDVPGQNWAFMAFSDSTQTSSAPAKVTANPLKIEILSDDRVIDIGAMGEFEAIGFNGKAYYAGTDQSNTSGTELWESDGTPVGTIMVNDLFPSGGSSDPKYLTVFNNELYFSATDDGTTTGRELYKVDAAGTMSLAWDIESGIGSSDPNSLTVFGDKLCFFAWSTATGRELFCLDSAETPFTYNINGASSDSIMTTSEMIIFSSKLYFTATNGTDGYELWSYDGTNPPIMVADINTTSDSNPHFFEVLNSKLFFFADDGVIGTEPYSYNGTNVTLIQDICPSGCSTNPTDVVKAGNYLYFVATDIANGLELWQSNGVSAAMVSDIYTSGDSSPEKLTAMGDRLLFVATPDALNYKLYITDNTGSAVSEIQDFNNSSESRIYPIDNNNAVIYNANTFTTHLTDGTAYDALTFDTSGSTDSLKRVSKWKNINFLFTEYNDGMTKTQTSALRLGNAPATYDQLPNQFIKGQELPGTFPVNLLDQLVPVP